MKKKIAILGSGIIGLCSGYHLLKKGHAVTFYDRNEPGSGASYGNAGSFSDYGAVPLLLKIYLVIYSVLFHHSLFDGVTYGK